MMDRPFDRLAAALALTFTLMAPLGAQTGTQTGTQTGDWSQFRGPNAQGEDLRGALPDGPYGLAVAWTRELGSGYSDVSISGQTAVTMFTAGEVDVVAAFSVGDGNELWRYTLGEKYAGHDGSTDGPLSTPTIVDGSVYVLGPSGQLVALGLADGSEQWRRQLDEESSTVPFYGYTSSPVVAGDLLLLATGGEGRAITAFDRASGEPRWTGGDDSVTYQTPTLIELGGRELLVAATDKKLHAFDPANGKTVWELQHTEGNQNEQSAHVVPIDADRFLVKYNAGARLYKVAGDGVEEVWQTNAFAGGFAIPIRVGDHLYGFTRRFLTCASLETGEIVWRSRPPGGLALSLIDGVLAVFSPEGDLVLVEPSPDGYKELNRTSVLEAGDHSGPSFSNGMFLVRNLAQLAAVRVDPEGAPQLAEANDADRLKGAFGAWIAKVEAMPTGERQAAVDDHFSGIESTPIAEEDGTVAFVWRGEAEDVGLSGDPVGGGQEAGLHRVEGTDLFFHSLELDPKAQYAYSLSVDFGQPGPDPSNPHTIDNGFAVASDLRMPQWPASPHLDEPADGAARGTLDSFPFASEVLGNTRTIQVWRPSGYDQDPEARYPLLVVNHGDNLLRGSLMRNTLDNLVGNDVAPLIAVFVPRVAAPEYGGPQVDDYLRFVTDELLPHIDRHYRTDGTRRAMMGPGSAGVTAVYAALKHPEIFQRAAVQSFYPIEPASEAIPEMMGGAQKPEMIYVVWSNHDYDLGEDRRADEASRALIEQLKEAGIPVTEQVANYSPGWGGWRGQHDEVLRALWALEALMPTEGPIDD